MLPECNGTRRSRTSGPKQVHERPNVELGALSDVLTTQCPLHVAVPALCPVASDNVSTLAVAAMCLQAFGPVSTVINHAESGASQPGRPSMAIDEISHPPPPRCAVTEGHTPTPLPGPLLPSGSPICSQARKVLSLAKKVLGSARGFTKLAVRGPVPARVQASKPWQHAQSAVTPVTCDSASAEAKLAALAVLACPTTAVCEWGLAWVCSLTTCCPWIVVLLKPAAQYHTGIYYIGARSPSAIQPATHP